MGYRASQFRTSQAQVRTSHLDCEAQAERRAANGDAGKRGDGIDYEINYIFGLDCLLGTRTGNFTASLAGTYLITREDVPFADFPETTNVLDEELGFPEHFINFSLAWNLDRLNVVYGVNYQSSQFRVFGFPVVERELIEDDPQFINDPKTGDAFVHFVGGCYDVTANFELSLRVNNLFNREPFDAGAQELRFRPVSALGRVIQMGARARF